MYWITTTMLTSQNKIHTTRNLELSQNIYVFCKFLIIWKKLRFLKLSIFEKFWLLKFFIFCDFRKWNRYFSGQYFSWHGWILGWFRARKNMVNSMENSKIENLREVTKCEECFNEDRWNVSRVTDQKSKFFNKIRFIDFR